MQLRQGELASSWLRCNRFYQIQDFWYFSTREGVDYGPFDSHDEANNNLQQYIQKLNQRVSASS